MRLIRIVVFLCVIVPVYLGTPAIALPPDGRHFSYESFLRGSKKGVSVTGFAFEPLSSGPLTLQQGTLHISGRILPPPPAAGTSFFPHILRLAITHLAVTGTLLSRETFDLLVNDSGAIPSQTFFIPHDTVVRAKERLLFSLTPIDRRLPACILSITASMAPQNIMDSAAADPPPFPRPGILNVSYSATQHISAQQGGREAFHFRLALPGGQGLLWKPGVLSVAGNIISISATPPALPKKVIMIVRHRNPDGQQISVDKNVILISSSGMIPQQTFPLSTLGPDQSREVLEISFVPVDAPIPAGVVKAEFSYSPH